MFIDTCGFRTPKVKAWTKEGRYFRILVHTRASRYNEAKPTSITTAGLRRKCNAVWHGTLRPRKGESKCAHTSWMARHCGLGFCSGVGVIVFSVVI